MNAPGRIWAVHHETQGAVMIGEWADTIRHIGGDPYILATPAALSASPEVQALIAAERERCVAVVIATCNAEIVQAKKLGPMHVPIIISVKHDCIAAIRAGTEVGE